MSFTIVLFFSRRAYIIWDRSKLVLVTCLLLDVIGVAGGLAAYVHCPARSGGADDQRRGGAQGAVGSGADQQGGVLSVGADAGRAGDQVARCEQDRYCHYTG